MTPARWRELEELYRAVQGLSPAEQQRLLESADPELRSLLAKSLVQEQTPPEAASLLDSPAWLDRPAWEDHESLLETEIQVVAGTQLGPYRIEEPIGRGGMGEVFRATDTRLQRTVAIKTSLVQFTERFQREARAIAALNHPHIATLYDVGSTPEGLGYLVLEYVEGPTLAELINKGPVAPAEVQRIALMTAEAIEAAHDKGIVHRDLKPANIKIGPGDVVKVLDFGLAKAVSEAENTLPDDTTQRGMILGTPSYMSPEQALGGPIDRRSDIWSFGVLVGEMLSGKRVFSGAATSEILASVVRGEPDLSGVPREWKPLLGRCLTKDVRRRLQSIGEARVALEDGLPVPAEQVRQRLVWPWMVLVAALALIAAGLWRNRGAAELANPLANATFTPLTDYEGTQVDASISPDGKFVAFQSDRNGPSHVWLDQIGAGNPIDLTPGPEDQRGPLRSVGFSHDGTELWIAGTESRRLKMVPLVGGKPRVFLGEKVVNPIWSPDGARLAYHTVEAGDPIFVADGDGSNPRQIFRDTPDKHNHYLAWGANGEWIYFVHGTPARQEMDLWRISVSGGKPERLTQLNTAMRDPTPLDQGTILFVARERNGSGPSIWAFDIAHRASRRIAFGLEQYTSLSATADGRRLAVTVANPDARLWSVPIGGTPGSAQSEATESDVKPFLPNTTRAMAPRFRGSAVYYLSSTGAGDRLLRFDGGNAVDVWGGPQNGLEGPPAISPDGRRIAAVTRQGTKKHLRLITADGAESSVIAPKIDVEGSADWSPDGNWIVTGGNDGQGAGLFKIPLTGGEPVRLTSKVGRNPVWSPDGSLIAYAGPNVFTLAPLLAVRPDGTPVKMPEIRTQRDGERLRFLPDGRGLIFMRAAEATPWQDFWLLDLTTMNTRRLTRLMDRATMRTFDITPDGKQIVFDRLRENSAVVLIDRQPSK
ncbi:MAG: protein kinase [Bryobacterales bacterium]|nr:protein kinase [Bryobacterales bacterium]